MAPIPTTQTRAHRKRWSGAGVASRCVMVAIFASLLAVQAQTNGGLPGIVASPWGISASASSSKNHTEWFPKMAAAGVSTVRLFPEWRGIEPTRGNWNWDRADALLETAAANKIGINAILMGSSPGTDKAHAFPMDDLAGWSNYVFAVVHRYKGRIHYWEVWNEGNGAFNDEHHTAADYARLAVTTYEVAKQADPSARVGLTVASFDAPYLNQVFRAQRQQGKPASFDYVCIHPYEIADGLTESDGEIPFLWMAHTLRQALRASVPERADAEIWITEVGRRIEDSRAPKVTDTEAAIALVKVYTLAMAQGIRCIQWFEAQDPVGEEAGFGLLKRDGTPRAGYATFQTMVKRLGTFPIYEGWLALGREGRGYGFVFHAEPSPILVAWIPAGESDSTLRLAADVEVVDSVSGLVSKFKAGEGLPLTDRPVFVTDIPDDLLRRARANAQKPFPWGGDHGSSSVVRSEPGNPRASQGIFQVRRDSTPTVRFADGSTGILVRGDQAVSFQVHPSFGGFERKDYYVRVAVRRVTPGNVGMNLFYEVADSQGRSPYRNRGEWFGLSDDAGWQTHTWHVSDACFSKMWGYDFSFRPEQSVPFVIGKVEVSPAPFE